MFIYGGLTFRKETKMKIIRRKKMKTYDKLKPWSLVFGHNGLTRKLIGPKLNNMLLITQGQTMSQKMFKFSILTPTPNLNWAFVECNNSNSYTFNLME